MNMLYMKFLRYSKKENVESNNACRADVSGRVATSTSDRLTNNSVQCDILHKHVKKIVNLYYTRITMNKAGNICITSE